MLVAVLKDWVTETNPVLAASSRSTELRKVGEGTGQSVDLVDHNPVDETGIDVVEQALQARALQGSSREPRVLVDGWQQHPALRFLARDIRGAGFSLRIGGS